MRSLREWPPYPRFAFLVSLAGLGAAVLLGDEKVTLLMALLSLGFIPEDALTGDESILRELLWGLLGVALWHVSSGLFSWVFLVLGVAMVAHGFRRLVQKF